MAAGSWQPEQQTETTLQLAAGSGSMQPAAPCQVPPRCTSRCHFLGSAPHEEQLATHQPPAAAYIIQAHTSFLLSSLQSTPTSPSQHQLSPKAPSKISSHALCTVHDSTSQPRPSHTRHMPILISDRHSPSHPGSETRPKTLLCIAGLPKSPRLLTNPTHTSSTNHPKILYKRTSDFPHGYSGKEKQVINRNHVAKRKQPIAQSPNNPQKSPPSPWYKNTLPVRPTTSLPRGPGRRGPKQWRVTLGLCRNISVYQVFAFQFR